MVRVARHHSRNRLFSECLSCFGLYLGVHTCWYCCCHQNNTCLCSALDMLVFQLPDFCRTWIILKKEVISHKMHTLNILIILVCYRHFLGRFVMKGNTLNRYNVLGKILTAFFFFRDCKGGSTWQQSLPVQKFIWGGSHERCDVSVESCV